MMTRLYLTVALLAASLRSGAEGSRPCTGTSNYTYAQRLVDDTVAHHPELTALVMHVTPPGASDNMIIASNIWLTGQKSDDDDVHVITSGITNTETNKAGTKFEVELVMKAVDGATLGSVATVFPYKRGDSKAALEKRAQQIRDELGRRIVSVENLFDPFPFDLQTPSHTYAQKLVDEAMARYKDVEILAIHGTPPNRSASVILGSNIGRVGRMSEEDEIEVARTGIAHSAVRASGNRYEVILPIKDRAGKIIGTVNVLLPFGHGVDPAQAKARAVQIADHMQSMIPTLTSLFEPVHD